MSTTASSVSPSPFVIPHIITTGSNPSSEAAAATAARNAHQHALVMVSKGKVGGGKNKNKKNLKKYSRKSSMKKRFSKKFRRSILRRKSRKMSLHKNKKALHGGSGNKLIIPSFPQSTGTNIINQLAGNHGQTLAYSEFDDQVSKPTVS
jgi:hypothetical protein